MRDRRISMRDSLLTAIVASALAICGCSSNPNGETPKVENKSGEVSQLPVGATNANASGGNVNFNQSFDDAVITEVIDGQHFPPNLTIGGKKTGALRGAVEEIWPQIKLTDPAGRPIGYVVSLSTPEGSMTIQLSPEIAPNHVRNFLALAHLGYYDGLCFERVVHQEAETEGGKSRLDLIVAGCPTGTGDEGLGHIGYFVRSELQADLKHAEGSVGFWHEEDPDSAGTRFYITLGPAPAIDGKFTIIGAVTTGLDVVKKIAAAPLQGKDTFPESEKPVHPVCIQKATVAPKPVEK